MIATTPRDTATPTGQGAGMIIFRVKARRYAVKAPEMPGVLARIFRKEKALRVLGG
jgi:hypothetical protein